MKDKSKGKIIIEFVGLKSKTYSFFNVDGKENKKAKGVDIGVAENARHKEYLDVLINKKIMRHIMKIIQSKLHNI